MDYLERLKDREDNGAAPDRQDEDYAFETARQKRVDEGFHKENSHE